MLTGIPSRPIVVSSNYKTREFASSFRKILPSFDYLDESDVFKIIKELLKVDALQRPSALKLHEQFVIRLCQDVGDILLENDNLDAATRMYEKKIKADPIGMVLWRRLVRYYQEKDAKTRQNLVAVKDYHTYLRKKVNLMQDENGKIQDENAKLTTKIAELNDVIRVLHSESGEKPNATITGEVIASFTMIKS